MNDSSRSHSFGSSESDLSSYKRGNHNIKLNAQESMTFNDMNNNSASKNIMLSNSSLKQSKVNLLREK